MEHFPSYTDDRDYRDWLRANPNGFVLDDYDGPGSVLHTAACPLIGGGSHDPPNGGSWTGDWGKICLVDIDDLRNFVSRTYGGQWPHPHQQCGAPLVP